MILTTAQILIIAGGLILTVLLIISLSLSISNHKKLKRIMMNSKNGDLADKIEEYYKKIDDTAEEIRNAHEILSKLREDCALAFASAGIVSFDAFGNQRGGYSFCLALLNQHNDGFIITSLYGNDSCNTYIKSVKNGTADIKLMNEEKEALQKALYNQYNQSSEAAQQN